MAEGMGYLQIIMSSIQYPFLLFITVGISFVLVDGMTRIFTDRRR